MIARMTRFTISLPDDIAEQVKAVADGNVSAWMTEVARKALIARSVAAEAAWYRQHPGFADDAEIERHAA